MFSAAQNRQLTSVLDDQTIASTSYALSNS